MNSKTSIWLWTASAAVVTGAVSLYSKVKTAAVRHLNEMGVFKKAQDERLDALRQLPEAECGEALKKAEKECIDISLEDEGQKKKGKWVESAAARKINQSYREKKHDIIHGYGADSFMGAWNILAQEEKTKAMGYSAVNAIVAGGLTYAIVHSSRKNRGKGKGRNGNGCGAGGCGHGHGGGGHGCGHGCGGGGGCGGGCGGGG